MIERRLFVPDQTLHAPHLLDIEISLAIHRYAANSDINAECGSATDGGGDKAITVNLAAWGAPDLGATERPVAASRHRIC
jgi:hypothetical protein